MIQHGPAAFPRGLRAARPAPELQLVSELEECRRQLASVLHSLAGIFYRCELKAPWRMSFVSEGIESLTGFTALELEAQNGWSDIMRVEDRSAIESVVAEAVLENRSFDVSYRITCKSGGVRWVSERGSAIYDEHGNPLFLEGVITDISGRKETDELQKTMIKRWGRTLDSIPQMVWTMGGDGSEEFYNAQWLRFTGCRLAGPEGVSRGELIHVDDQSRVISLWQEKFATGEPYEAQYRIKHFAGGYRWILSRGHPECDANGNIKRWYGTCTDIHDEVIGRQALEASEAVNRSMIEASPDCISLLDIDGRTSFLNRAAVKALGLKSSATLLGLPWAFGFPASFRGPAAMAIAQAVAGGTGRFTAMQPKPEGVLWWDIVVAPIRGEGALISGFICIARDITHQKTAEDRIRWAANHDPLTQLPNRALFQRTLDRSIANAQKSGGSVTVLMMDLDDFKRTNDALGHDAGDALLTEFADRLKDTLRAVDLVARIGGDEFAILLQGVGEEQEVKAAVESIQTRLKIPFEFGGKLLDIRASIGASTFPSHGLARTELLKHADTALYVAKRAGRAALRIFQPAMRAESQKRLSMLDLARNALRDDAIVATYQPKVDLRSGRLDGFEALLRWKHPTKGLQTPDTLASAFEDGVIAAEISDRIIQYVIADMRRWTDAGISFGHVAVNAGAAEFKPGNFADKLLEQLSRAGLSTSCLQIEVTETVFLGRGAEHVEDTLRALSHEGVQIALDDFGTGYASLAHLNKFPVNVIKIDRSFISELETSAHDAAIVRAVIKLGRSLGIRIVAEGIESQRQAEFLRKHRCDAGQGYLFGKAVTASLVPMLIGNWGAARVAA